MSDREQSRGPLRSSIMTEGVDRATHRSLFYSMGLILLWFLWISCYTSETDGIATHWRVISYPTVHPLQIQLRNQRIRFNSRENNLSFRGSAVVDIVIKPQYCFRERSTVTGNSLFKKLETTI